MQHATITRRTGMLFEYVAQTQIQTPGGKTRRQTPPQPDGVRPGLDLLFRLAILPLYKNRVLP